MLKSRYSFSNPCPVYRSSIIVKIIITWTRTPKDKRFWWFDVGRFVVIGDATVASARYNQHVPSKHFQLMAPFIEKDISQNTVRNSRMKFNWNFKYTIVNLKSRDNIKVEPHTFIFNLSNLTSYSIVYLDQNLIKYLPFKLRFLNICHLLK